MKKRGLGTMSVWQRWLTIFTLGICSLSGIAFLLGHEFLIWQVSLGNHAVLRLHGIVSLLALMAFGAAMPYHLKAGLKAKKNLFSGIAQLAFLIILVITALLLYYGPEELRDSSKLIHWLIGLVFFSLFFYHAIIRSFKRSTEGMPAKESSN